MAPVGIGKTLIALSIWDRLARPNTLIVVPRIVLIQNPWLKEMEKVGIPSDTVGQYYSELKRPRHPITLTLYQSLSTNPKLIEDFDLVVFDEEQFLTEGYAGLLGKTTATRYVLGMTGTLAEAARKNPQLTQALPVVFESSIAQARDRHMLAQAEIVPVYVDLPREEKLEYLEDDGRVQQRPQDGVQGAGPPRPDRGAHSEAEDQPAALEHGAQVGEDPGDNRERPLRPDPRLLALHPEHRGPRGQAGGEGIHSRMLTHELTDRAKRQEIVDGFGRDYNVLMSVGTLEVGFNVPNATREIIMANTGSLTRMEQRLGQGPPRDPGIRTRWRRSTWRS